jgi:hypothetical protein
MKLKLIAAAIAFAFAAAAQAQTTPAPAGTPKSRTEQPRAEQPRAEKTERKVKDQEEERIEQQAKADKERCNGMKGNAKDICMAEAKGKEKVAKAELDAKHDPSPRNQRKAAEMKAEAAYEVAKERCDDQKGDAKDQCQKAAKDKQAEAKRQIREQYAQKPDRPAAGAGATARPDRKSDK